MTPQEVECMETFFLLSLINVLVVVFVLSVIQIVFYGPKTFKEFFLPYKVFSLFQANIKVNLYLLRVLK